MRDLDPLACARKQNRVVPHNVAASDSGKTNRVGVAFASVAITLVDRALAQIAAHGL